MSISFLLRLFAAYLTIKWIGNNGRDCVFKLSFHVGIERWDRNSNDLSMRFDQVIINKKPSTPKGGKGGVYWATSINLNMIQPSGYAG